MGNTILTSRLVFGKPTSASGASLTGSTSWVEYEGTSVVRSLECRANLVELGGRGRSSRFQGLNLRFYQSRIHQWSLNFASSNSGTLSQPTIGEFKNGRGEFFDQETLSAEPFWFDSLSRISPNSCHFEQAFSGDGGKTWEVNWIATERG